MTETGGQVWTSETNTQANGQTVRVFWSQFNGFWTGNPAVTNTTGTLPLTVYGFAFDMAPGLYPDIDVPFVSGSHAGGTVTVPSFTTNTTGVLALAGWISSDNNTWSAPTAGWSAPGGQAQWRNSNGSDNSIALAYRLIGPAGPSGTIVRTQSASGPDTGIYFRLAFRALEIPANPPGDPTDLLATASVGQVALTWTDTATNEAGFNIERCAGVNCTNFTPLAVLGPNATSYNDINLFGHDDVSVSGAGLQSLQSVGLLEYRGRRNARGAAPTGNPVHVPIGRHALPDCGQHGRRWSRTTRRDTSSDDAGR